jgi:formylmethanofuran dehydrogenase subunit E
MHRPGSDPLDMRAEDFLCDFCGEHWSEERPMVEGHHGSLVCGPCLTAAFRTTWLAGGTPPVNSEGEECRLCLERRDEPHWRGATGGLACRRCVKMSVVMLERDVERPESERWKRPEA